MDIPSENPMAAADENHVPAPPARQPGVWSGLGTVALYFLLQFGFGLLVGVAIGFWVAFKAGFFAGLQHRKPQLHNITQAAMASPELRVVLTVVTIAAAAAVMIALVRQTWPALWSRADLPGFGFARPKKASAYVAAVLLGVAILLCGGILTHFLAQGHPFHQDVSVLAGKVPLGMRVVLALLVVCVAPIVEELVFRGVLLSGLARRMHVGWAILVSAVIFGCVHLPDFRFAWYPVPALILLGLVSGWLRVRARSLWPSITLHATNNLVAAILWLAVAHH
ncbi:MAG TPA: CPBP family intramembrane glutamic endopeptidase [Rhodanobacteraceae bacterium]|nr:CPBP family intramembrane glutamic endopeptidase [Rhodanobacteraceae bacterium]